MRYRCVMLMRQLRARVTGFEPRRAEAAPIGAASAALSAWVRGVALPRREAMLPAAFYLLAATLLLLRIGSYPNFAYNWESYTAWGFFPFRESPSAAIFDLTDGLMTDSGRLPLVVLPGWLGVALGGVGLAALRVPVALIAALALPLLWLVGRRLTGQPAALLAAGLFGLSPVYFLYARTATVVGISLVPALLTVYALIRTLQDPRRWRWLVVLQVLLVVNSYAYAPIRFLWPISLVLIAGEIIWRTGLRRRLLLPLGVTALVLPAALVLIDQDPGYQPLTAIADYYNGRGEHILALTDDPEGFQFYLTTTPEERAAGGVSGSPEALAWRLVRENVADFSRLLFDRETRPALTDYWNPHGRLYPWFLAPFFVLGVATSLRRARRSVEDRALQTLFWGFSLPLLLTSQVHIGRLIFALPFLCLLIALGLVTAGRWLAAALSRFVPDVEPRGMALPLVAVVSLAVAWSSWHELRVELPTSRELQTAEALAAAPAVDETTGSAALVLGGADRAETEAITVASYRLALDGRYRFVNLNRGENPSANGDPRPTILFGGLLDLLANPTAIPSPCEVLYYVDPALLDQFLATITGDSWTSCGAPPRYRLLPG